MPTGQWPNPVSGGRSHPPRPQNRRLIGNLKSRGAGSDVFIFELVGLNVVAEHFENFASAVPGFAYDILDVVSDIGMEEAREMVGWDRGRRFQNRTGETRRSINKSPGVIAKPNIGEWSVRYGPTTFYAPFLEYGTSHARPYPFMLPSGDLAEAILYSSVHAFLDLLVRGGDGMVGINGGRVGGRALSDPRIKGSFTGLRSALYSSAKALGDISVFGGRGVFGPLRSSMYSLARGLGDVSSIMNRTIGTRITNRLGGRVTGRIIGFGSHSLSYSRTYSAFPGGSGGHRVYQRIAGRFGKTGLGASSASISNFLSGR